MNGGPAGGRLRDVRRDQANQVNHVEAVPQENAMRKMP